MAVTLPCGSIYHLLSKLYHGGRKLQPKSDPTAKREILGLEEKEKKVKITIREGLNRSRPFSSDSNDLLTIKPYLASLIAGSNNRFHGSFPCRRCNISHPRISPGTPTANPPMVDALGSGLSTYIVLFPASGIVSRKSIYIALFQFQLNNNNSQTPSAYHFILMVLTARKTDTVTWCERTGFPKLNIEILHHESSSTDSRMVGCQDTRT